MADKDTPLFPEALAFEIIDRLKDEGIMTPAKYDYAVGLVHRLLEQHKQVGNLTFTTAMKPY